MVEWKKLCKEAEESDEKRPPITNYIGECFMNIAEHLSRKGNFVNYPYREEMVSDGIENCLMYAHNFDPEKSKNPFSYFTQIIYYAFLRRIEHEKKHLYIKQKTLENFYFEGMLAEQAAGEETRSVNVDLNNEYMNNLVSTYDKKQEEKKLKSKIKKETGLEKFIDEPE